MRDTHGIPVPITDLKVVRIRSTAERRIEADKAMEARDRFWHGVALALVIIAAVVGFSAWGDSQPDAPATPDDAPIAYWWAT